MIWNSALALTAIFLQLAGFSSEIFIVENNSRVIQKTNNKRIEKIKREDILRENFQIYGTTVHTQQMVEEREARKRNKEAERCCQEEKHAEHERREEERRLETLRRDTPRMSPMEKGEDVEDYLELFETYVQSLQLDREKWLNYLQPLFNRECQDAVMGLDPEDRISYDAVKWRIIGHWDSKHARPGGAYSNWKREKDNHLFKPN